MRSQLRGIVGAVCVGLATAVPPAEAIAYNFDNGTLQGSTQVSVPGTPLDPV